MITLTGAFVMADGFLLTGRGLVLVGQLTGQVHAGDWLVVENKVCWLIKGVALIRRS